MMTLLLLRSTALYAIFVFLFMLFSILDVYNDSTISAVFLPLDWRSNSLSFVWTATAFISIVLCRQVISDATQDLKDVTNADLVNRRGLILTARVNILISTLLAIVHISFALIGLYAFIVPPPPAPQVISHLERLLSLFFIAAALDLGMVSWFMIWLRYRLLHDI